MRSERMRRLGFCLTAGALLSACAGTEPQTANLAQSDPCAVALAEHADNDKRLTDAIGRARRALESNRDPTPRLENLGWLYVAKARSSHDDGLYSLADRTAACLESKQEDSAGAALLRGHLAHAGHRFAEAEQLARLALAADESPYAWGLLGDALMEQGRLDETEQAYQRMIDIKPGLQSYSRGAHLRRLYGDLSGAIELQRLAAAAGGGRNSEATAWALSRLALYELESGQAQRAIEAADGALRRLPAYAPALLARGRILLAGGDAASAAESLEQAVEANPLPEYRWALADALRSLGREAAATAVEADLLRAGAMDDPRTTALFLATRGDDVATALRLARRELESRQDALTYDAWAWALLASGQVEDARTAMADALRTNVQDARLFLHAGAIAAAAGRTAEARRRLDRAAEMESMLLPSERIRLNSERARLRSPSSTT